MKSIVKALEKQKVKGEDKKKKKPSKKPTNFMKAIGAC